MRFCIIAILALCSSGCLMEAVTVTAIQGELAAQNMKASNRALGKAKDSKAEIELASAINSYAGTTGFYPKKLQELVPNYIVEIPTQSNGLEFAYDSARGKVSYVPLGSAQPVRPENAIMTQSDQQNLGDIRDAIYSYWEMTGNYPESLESLSPLYIQTIPIMSSGDSFPYNRHTGVVSHPAEFQRPQAPTPVGQPAGRSASGQVGAIANGHSQRQLDTLNELGF